MKTISLVVATIALVLVAPIVAVAEPRVQLELATEPGFPITGAHQWIEVLKDLGFENLRIRRAQGGERAEVQTTGAGDSAVYRVTGILSSSNLLIVPTGRFRLSDRGEIAKWVESLKAGGVEELTAPRTAFGLTEREFLELHEKLAAPVEFSTKDQSAFESIKTLVRALPVRVDLDPGARAALEADWQVPEEMRGMSRGTALAAMLRPLGLAFIPERQAGGRVNLKIARGRDLEESWPVGWPSDRNPRETAPNLFKFLNVEIADTPVSETLAAIQGRLEMPFLYDHNALARERIDPAAVNASLPAGRTYYMLILKRILSQAKLFADLRVDDAGQPLLWITTVSQR
ncbi:MAG: hypothetical protein KY475_26705 [Planctomycetes bacterium]|nr:hypothetical protein [Planctomycetota bacterium]